MTFSEAVRLAEELLTEPDSHLFAAVSGWDHPASREWLLFAQWFDIDVEPKVRKPFKGFPRPWGDGEVTRQGNAAGRSPEQVAAILAAHGHSIN